MIRNEFFPVAVSHHSLDSLRVFILLPWPIRVNDKTLLKGLRIFPGVQKKSPINESLVSYVLIMLYNEFCPLIFSNHSFRRLIRLFFLTWIIRVSIDSTQSLVHYILIYLVLLLSLVMKNAVEIVQILVPKGPKQLRLCPQAKKWIWLEKEYIHPDWNSDTKI